MLNIEFVANCNLYLNFYSVFRRNFLIHTHIDLLILCLLLLFSAQPLIVSSQTHKYMNVCKYSQCIELESMGLPSLKDYANQSFPQITSELSVYRLAYEWRDKNNVLDDAPISLRETRRFLSDPGTAVPVSVINDDVRNPPSSDHRVCARAHLSKTILMDSS